ncbi:NmrA family NAD(P)-binding protein [Streptomyces purpureus]|uniref:NmrA family NAD(P)-binding protein n=1 Tax=Streptomyces purpureus TaxID=1951 RepID=UPI00069034B9|nr:NmrA family NAD(P)-binding protein [Streptomyces purpureus]
MTTTTNTNLDATPVADTASIGTVLVTSGSGKTGRRVAERLQARNVTVRSGSRRGSTVFDWEAPETWGPALSGADAAYVAYYPDVAAPGAVEAMDAFGKLAAGLGVRRLVLLSGRGEPEALQTEDALREAATGVELTVVQASFFAQNFNEGAMADGVRAGAIPFPAGTTAEPFIDADDLADVLVATLLEDGHAGLVHEVTGPRLLTFDEVAAEISRASGRTVTYVPVSGEEYAAMLEEYGLPRPEAQWLAGLFSMLLDGHNASVTDGVERVLGRAPKDFGSFAAAAWQRG